MKKHSNRQKQRGILLALLSVLTILYLASFLTACTGIKSAPAIHSQTGILVSCSDAKTYYAKNDNDKIYPASLTKILTVYTAITLTEDVSKTITAPEEIFPALYEANASLAGFKPGETAPMIDFLYGAMMPSGAECCLALADSISGSEKAFVKEMNAAAKKIGMKNTHFVNCTGLHDDNHYTTVSDLAKLICRALQNETFAKVFTTYRHSVMPTNKHADGFTFWSTALKGYMDYDFSGYDIIGGKTGYTPEAGLCLATLAGKGDKQYLFISTGVKGDHHTRQYQFEDALLVFDTYLK